MRDDERELYRLHARLPVYRRHVERAVGIVRQAMATHPGEWAVACSGGKDSTALLSIAVAAGWRGRLFHFWSAETPPENSAMVATLGAHFGCDLLTARVRGDWDAWERLGHAFVIAGTAEESAAARRSNVDYKRDADEAAREAGFSGLMLGMRADESKNRAIVVRSRGVIYQTKNRSTMTALPLAGWTARDVWARICGQGLPFLSRYDTEPDRERTRSEITWLGFEGLWRHGQGAQLFRSDPELWSRMIARWPELQRWM